MRFSGWQRGCFPIGVLLALLLGGASAPNAHAGCSGPLVVSSPDMHLPYHAEADLLASAWPLSMPHHSAPPKPPCSGPHCSGAPLPPQTPPATTITLSQDWACLPFVATGLDHQGFAHLLENGPLMPIFRTSAIYHPPRGK